MDGKMAKLLEGLRELEGQSGGQETAELRPQTLWYHLGRALTDPEMFGGGQFQQSLQRALFNTLRERQGMTRVTGKTFRMALPVSREAGKVMGESMAQGVRLVLERWQELNGPDQIERDPRAH
jgi:hypothetical protein